MQERFPKILDIQDAGQAFEINIDDLVEIPKENHNADASKMVEEFKHQPPEPATERVIYLNFRQTHGRTNI